MEGRFLLDFSPALRWLLDFPPTSSSVECDVMSSVAVVTTALGAAARTGTGLCSICISSPAILESLVLAPVFGAMSLRAGDTAELLGI